MVTRSAEEEKWNAGTHLFGAGLASVGLAWLMFRPSENWQSVSGVACVVYAGLLVLMFSMSTLSHWYRDERRLKRFRSLDQASIFLLITGTYMPLSIHFWDTMVANGLLIAMWAISIAGFIAKFFFTSCESCFGCWLRFAGLDAVSRFAVS